MSAHESVEPPQEIPIALYVSLWVPTFAVMVWGVGRFWRR